MSEALRENAYTRGGKIAKEQRAGRFQYSISPLVLGYWLSVI
jgi:hypothetical protein